MKAKLIKKYLGQGTLFAFLGYFSNGSLRTLKYLIKGDFELFMIRINSYHIGNLAWWFGVIIITIPSLSILCYSTDKLLVTLLEKSLKSKKKQIYSKMGLFFLKYALVGVFYFFAYRGGIYIDRFLIKINDFYYSYYLPIMVGLCILFNYLVNWIIFLMKRHKKHES